MSLPTFFSFDEACEWGRHNYPNAKWCFDGLGDGLLQLVVEQFHALAQSFPKVADSIAVYALANVVDEPEDNPGFAYYHTEHKGIYLNFKYWQDATALKDRVVDRMVRQRLPVTCIGKPLEYLIAHEFGHAVYQMFCLTEQYQAWKELKQVCVSSNAKRNELERFADAFACGALNECNIPYVKTTFDMALEALN